MKHKMVIVMRTDLRMSRGKMASQAAHAATMRFLNMYDSADAEDKKLSDWIMESGMAKIVVRVDSLGEFAEIAAAAHLAGVDVRVVTDGTLRVPTCIAIGPDLSEVIDGITGKLRLL